ncbi:MAG: hypothetical protein NVS2B14_14620 [Chamaesiphon sp.]
MLTRPGYGERPIVSRTHVEQDVKEIITMVETEGGGHLVGYSYGGVIALIAAASRPDLIRSLTVVEPPAYSVACGNPLVEEQISKMKVVYEPERPLTAEEFCVRLMKALGQDIPDSITLSPEDRKGLEAMRAEPPPWAIEIALSSLEATTFPKLIVSGDWHPAFEAVADVLTKRLHAQRVICKGASHYILDTGELFNQQLDTFLQSVINE